MKTKIVYSIVTNSEDQFLEQLLISTYSVKYYTPDAHIVLVIDNKSNDELVDNRQKALDYVDEKIVVTPPSLGKKSRSRWMKTSIREIVKGDYLFVDTDTIVTCDISGIDSLSMNVGAVLDRHLTIDRNQRGGAIVKQCKRCGWNPEEKDYKYYNSGVMLVRDCEVAHLLYKKWHDIWEKSYRRGIDIDQPALGLANREMSYVIEELDGTWNCQVLGNGLRYMNDAKILHYYNSDSRTLLHSNPFLFSSKAFQEKVSKSGFVLTDEIKQILDNPQNQFAESYELIADEKVDAYYSSAVQYVFQGYAKRSLFYTLFSGYVRILEIIKEFIKAHR